MNVGAATMDGGDDLTRPILESWTVVEVEGSCQSSSQGFLGASRFGEEQQAGTGGRSVPADLLELALQDLVARGLSDGEVWQMCAEPLHVGKLRARLGSSLQFVQPFVDRR